ncbi:MAG: glycosyltransferase family 2 protein [Prevotellaceae bacterium]|jgi:glycosyltransferase involved in cell wall biosynthesis|nr:glycosyltransferase family 2 protein [Prevotellaceae bacterium]
MENKDLLLSVVVCTYNREAYVLAALNSIVAQDFDKSKYELILVNNNSPDNTAALCENFGKDISGLQYRYVVEYEPGVSQARNRGVKEAQAPILVFIDDDGWAEPNLLSVIYKFYQEHPDAAATGGRVFPDFQSKRPRWMSHFLVPLTSSLDMGDSVKVFKRRYFPMGANMSFKTEAFKEYGMFHPGLGRMNLNLAGAEEKDLFYRIMNVGKKVYYVPQAVVHHAVPDSRLTYSFFKRQAVGIGFSEMYRAKNISTGEYILSLFLECLKWGATFFLSLFYLITHRPRKAWRIIVFRWYVSSGLLGLNKKM